MDTEAEAGLPDEYGINSIPTLMVFKDQRRAFAQAGAIPEPVLRGLVGEAKALDATQIEAQIA